jgi:4-hydroxy-3-methylbut-2-en-1-yl diphosphate synthase IspG/GcpE
VVSEYLLESPALIDSITSKAAAQVEPTDRQKKMRLAKLDEQIVRVTAEVREAAKAEPIAAVEERFGGVAA